jgi:hypothetical protein
MYQAMYQSLQSPTQFVTKQNVNFLFRRLVYLGRKRNSSVFINLPDVLGLKRQRKDRPGRFFRLFGEDMRSIWNTSKLYAGIGSAIVLLSVAGMSRSAFAWMGNGVAMQAAAPASNRFVGTISATGTGLITVKSDAGVERKVTVPDGIKIQRIAPGAKDLSSAAVITFADLAVGDRVLVRIAPDPAATAPGSAVTAISIVAIPQADLAQKQQQEREDWQRNGVGGLVKSVNAGTGDITIVSGAGATQKTTTLHTTPATVLKRYAADSIDFDKAQVKPIETIQVGDQLRARGTKSADGTEITAVEVVSGSFRNIAGTITTINAAAGTIVLKDLATKQTVTVHVGADAQMRKLPEMMAKMLANMTKPAEGGGAKPAGGAPAAGGQGGQGQGSQGQGRRSGGGGDLQTMLSRAPAIKLADLQKGDAVMLVSTQGTAEVTAVTLLAGVEPLLQAPASTQNMLLSNWNMSSGGAEAAQ